MSIILNKVVGERGRVKFTIERISTYLFKITAESPYFINNVKVECPTWKLEDKPSDFYPMSGGNGKYYTTVPVKYSSGLFTTHLYYYPNGIQTYIDEVLFKV